MSAPALNAPGTPDSTIMSAGDCRTASSASSSAAQWRLARALRRSGRWIPMRATLPFTLQLMTLSSTGLPPLLRI